MKKILGIVVLGFFINLSSFADENIYYCIDDEMAGFNATETGTKIINFKEDRFTAKINLDQKIFETNGLGIRQKWIANPSRNFFTDGSIASIRFYDKVNMKYFRSSLFGPDDSVILAMGSCSKF